MYYSGSNNMIYRRLWLFQIKCVGKYIAMIACIRHLTYYKKYACSYHFRISNDPNGPITPYLTIYHEFGDKGDVAILDHELCHPRADPHLQTVIPRVTLVMCSCFILPSQRLRLSGFRSSPSFGQYMYQINTARGTRT